jgi:hypothetical protein
MMMSARVLRRIPEGKPQGLDQGGVIERVADFVGGKYEHASRPLTELFVDAVV